MSGSNRSRNTKAIDWALPLIGIVLALCIAIGLGWISGLESERRYQSPHRHADYAEANAKRACEGSEPDALFECIYNRVEASEETARTEQDLSAQQRSASAALAAAIVSFITLIVTGIGVWFVKRTLDATLEAVEDTSRATKAMERQNEIAEDTSKRQLRAYIGAHDGTVENFRPGCKPRFTVKVVNAGQTPAYDVRMCANVKHGPGANPNIVKIHIGKILNGSRSTLSPQQMHTLSLPSENLLPEADHTTVMGGCAVLVFGGIISYRDVFGVRRRTVFKAFMRPSELNEEGNGPLSACSRGNGRS